MMEKLKVFLCLMLMLSVPTKCQSDYDYVEQETDSESNNWLDLIIEPLLKDFLKQYDLLHIPALPTVKYNNGNIDVAISLADMTLNGITDLKVHDSVLESETLTTFVDFKKISLDVGRYISGGHLQNLPFAGEGPLMVAIHELAISLKAKLSSVNGGHCAVAQSNALPIEVLELVLDQRRLEVKFSNMNLGQDQGQLINIFLSSLGPDIIDYLNQLLKSRVKEVADRIVIDTINTALCPGWVSNNPLNDKDEMAAFIYTIYQHFLDDLKLPKEGSDNMW